MENFFFKRILLLTIVVSGITFYGIFSVFASFTLRSINERTLPNGRLQYAPSKEYRDFAVRSIGLCIIASVGTGLTVAEVVRRQGKARKRKQSNDGFSPQASSSASKVELEQSERLSLEQSDTNSPQTFEIEDAINALSDSEISDVHPGLKLSQPEQICRIKVPQKQQSLLAILLDGQYYSFTRSEREPEVALQLLAQQSQKGNDVVITYTCDRYVIWRWQPKAEFHF
jgi:hypothetical protein